MKRILVVVFALFLTSFTQAQTGKSNIHCERKTNFGEAELCLPSINGMKECYENEVVKAFADQTEYETNKVLGYYLMDSTYKAIVAGSEFEMGDYFKIYGTTKLADYKAGPKELDMINDVVEKTLEPVNFAEIKKKMDAQLDSIDVGAPMLLEKYSKNKNSKSFVLLVKYSTEESSYMMVMSLNMLLIKDRIVNLAYYREYHDEADITAMKASSDVVVKRVLDEN
ncbi:MAG TPA: hypothetical protein PLD36_14015 [Bacteroidia bacterium]|jgi:hypothetical protein|nr:hypothetical protein [Bacteroidia bacterium]